MIYDHLTTIALLDCTRTVCLLSLFDLVLESYTSLADQISFLPLLLEPSVTSNAAVAVDPAPSGYPLTHNS